ncbi:MAG: MotA/TolQ/ExbB proton channel family protein [Phycisphaerales bacterium]|nr:MotA/TolQ/ExbB proton channel family protein [Phycisphaerales bacterium]
MFAKLMMVGISGALLAAGQGEPADGARAVQVQSVWDFLVKGGPMIIPIAVCSLAALTVIVERSLTLRRVRVVPPGFLEGVRTAFSGGPADALSYCTANPSPIATIFQAGLKRANDTPDRREKAIEEAGAREVFTLRKYLRLLAVVAAIAPVMGLLGTIFGMIKAFQTVALAGDALGKTELLAKGIYEALITTAAGLLLAIPALVCYHWLSSKIDRLVFEMDRITVEFFEDSDFARAKTTVAPRYERPQVPDKDGDDHAAAALARV